MFVMLAAAAAVLQSVSAGEPRGTPSDAQFARVREALNEQLMDYPSARFRDVRADGSRVCGFVNAKNAMGAYIGWRPFGVIDSARGAVLVVDDAYLIEPICTPALMATEADHHERLRHR